MARDLLSQEGPTTLDYKEILINILFKFVDLLQAVAVIVIGMLVIRYVRRWLQKIQVEHDAQRTALNLLEKLVTGFLIVITLTLALKIIGLDLTLIISALTLGLSFGLRDIIKNYVSGVLILFKAPFAIGDIVKIRSYVGVVEKIEFQSTTLKTFDRREVTIYNKDVLTQSLVNYSKELERRVEIPVRLGHGTDLKKAIAIFDNILENYPAILKTPRRTIMFKNFSDGGVTMVVRFWVKRPCNILKIRTEIALQIQQAFDEIVLLSPFTRDVQFETDVGMTDARKERLRAFYSQPALAAIAAATNGQLTQIVTPAAEEEFIDKDEPEVEEF